MIYKGVYRTAPATPSLLKILNKELTVSQLEESKIHFTLSVEYYTSALETSDLDLDDDDY